MGDGIRQPHDDGQSRLGGWPRLDLAVTMPIRLQSLQPPAVFSTRSDYSEPHASAIANTDPHGPLAAPSQGSPCPPSLAAGLSPNPAYSPSGHHGPLLQTTSENGGAIQTDTENANWPPSATHCDYMTQPLTAYAPTDTQLSSISVPLAESPGIDTDWGLSHVNSTSGAACPPQSSFSGASADFGALPQLSSVWTGDSPMGPSPPTSFAIQYFPASTQAASRPGQFPGPSEGSILMQTLPPDIPGIAFDPLTCSMNNCIEQFPFNSGVASSPGYHQSFPQDSGLNLDGTRDQHERAEPRSPTGVTSRHAPTLYSPPRPRQIEKTTSSSPAPLDLVQYTPNDFTHNARPKKRPSSEVMPERRAAITFRDEHGKEQGRCMIFGDLRKKSRTAFTDEQRQHTAEARKHGVCLQCRTKKRRVTPCLQIRGPGARYYL